MKRKKYRIRKYSPVWWAARVGAGVIAIAGSYCWILLIASFPA